MTTTKDAQRRLDYQLHRIRRPKTVQCQWCGGRIVVNPRGRLPDFCSESHRQLAYQQRKWQRPHAVAALADDIDAAKVRGVIREEIVAALCQTGIVPQAMPPPKPKPHRRPRLELVQRKDE
jgi:DNA-directed RNA polymerase subunit RPC12/RpoP